MKHRLVTTTSIKPRGSNARAAPPVSPSATSPVATRPKLLGARIIFKLRVSTVRGTRSRRRSTGIASIRIARWNFPIRVHDAVAGARFLAENGVDGCVSTRCLSLRARRDELRNLREPHVYLKSARARDATSWSHASAEANRGRTRVYFGTATVA